MARVYIGLGSNLGDRRNYLGLARAGIARIEGVRIAAESGIEETPPVGFHDQGDFLNQVILIETGLAPLDLLDRLQAIELSLGRVRDVPKGPRTIDLDILLYDDLVTRGERLTLPHPAIKERSFVMRELLSIDAHLCDPLTGIPYRDVLSGGAGEVS